MCLPNFALDSICLLYTSDAADEEDSVDLCGRRLIKKKKNKKNKSFLTSLHVTYNSVHLFTLCQTV